MKYQPKGTDANKNTESHHGQEQKQKKGYNNLPEDKPEYKKRKSEYKKPKKDE